MKKNLLTVKRRTDWVTMLGMVLFVLIVLGEITVAVGVPLLVREEGVMAAKVTKLTTLALFDATRSLCEDLNKSNPDSSLVKSEIGVIWESQNILADYLRENVESMSTRQFILVQERVRHLRSLLERLRQGKSYSARIELTMTDYLTKLAEPGK